MSYFEYLGFQSSRTLGIRDNKVVLVKKKTENEFKAHLFGMGTFWSLSLEKPYVLPFHLKLATTEMTCRLKNYRWTAFWLGFQPLTVVLCLKDKLRLIEEE